MQGPDSVACAVDCCQCAPYTWTVGWTQEAGLIVVSDTSGDAAPLQYTNKWPKRSP